MQSKVDDRVHVGGRFTAELWRDGPNGPECHFRTESPNALLQDGMEEMMRFLTGLVSKEFDQIRIGTCGAAAASNQTNLLSPYAGSLTTVDQMTFTGVRTMEWKASYPSGVGSVSGAIKELAILSQGTSPGGTALARGVITTANKTEDDKLILYYRLRAS